MPLAIEVMIAATGLIAIIYLARCMFATVKPSLQRLKTKRTAIGWTFAGIGLASFSGSVGTGAYTWWFITQAVATEGQIVEIVEHKDEEAETSLRATISLPDTRKTIFNLNVKLV